MYVCVPFSQPTAVHGFLFRASNWVTDKWQNSIFLLLLGSSSDHRALWSVSMFVFGIKCNNCKGNFF